MPDFLEVKSEFLDRVVTQIERELGNEQFGVMELADQLNMSRSSLLRKVQKITGQSVSVLIRNVRLHHAQELLVDDELTVSQVSFKVGFSSTSYFIKCFRERYGHSPGERRKIRTEVINIPEKKDGDSGIRQLVIFGSMILAMILLVSVWFARRVPDNIVVEKSIAVLPFINDSSDSSNVYIINGMMETILNNLQKIEDLRVVSRTSVEQYRIGLRSVPEIAEGLDVSYLLEGSGQKIGDQILLTIQLIEGKKDDHLWSKQYRKTTKNIFSLQSEVAADVAREIEIILTPEEQRLINKPITTDPEAFNLYMKGVEFAKANSLVGLDSGVFYFQEAIKLDPEFATAHAYIAICYYYQDLFKLEKQFSDEINTYADRALLLDSELGISLIAKGLFYMQDQQYERAAEYFEKSLEFNPNSVDSNHFLSLIYNTYLPDTEKYLVHALKGWKLEKTGSDSSSTSLTYLHLGNALAQNGFFNEAEQMIRTSLKFDPNNLFSEYVLAYILLAQGDDIANTRALIEKTLQKDTTRIDVIQEIAKVCYAMGDYESAWSYYEKMLTINNLYGFSIFESEDIKIAFVLKQLNKPDEAKFFLERFKDYAENDQTIYQNLSLSAYYAVMQDKDQAISHLRLFSEEENFQYWFLLFLEKDPIFSLVSDNPGFMEARQQMESTFWASHQTIKERLKKEDLL